MTYKKLTAIHTKALKDGHAGIKIEGTEANVQRLTAIGLTVSGQAYPGSYLYIQRHDLQDERFVPASKHASNRFLVIKLIKPINLSAIQRK